MNNIVKTFGNAWIHFVIALAYTYCLGWLIGWVMVAVTAVMLMAWHEIKDYKQDPTGYKARLLHNIIDIVMGIIGLLVGLWLVSHYPLNTFFGITVEW
jgi:hypothetical protein